MSRSLSAYARQFLDQLQKPDVDFIEGLSPAIAIEQRSSGSSPRSIIATTTEIYDYLRLLYAHIGQAHCPETGVPISTQSTSDIVDKILALPPKTKVMLLAPVVRRQKGEFRDVFERLAREGFVRVRVDGEIVELGENAARIKLDKKKFHNIEAVVDRLVIDDKIRVRLGDSVETALRWGEGVMFTLHQLPEESKVQSPKSKVAKPRGQPQPAIRNPQSNVDRNAALEQNVFAGDGQELRSADAETFFLQRARRRVPGLPRPRPENGFRRGARRAGSRRAAGKRHPAVAARGQADEHLLQGHAALGRRRISTSALETPWKDLPEDFKKVLLHGSGEDDMEFKFWRAGKVSSINRPFEGVLPNLERLATDSESEFIRNRLKAYMAPQFCDACRGKRLKPEILAVTLGRRTICLRNSKTKNSKLKTLKIPGLSIMDVCGLSVEKADEFFADAQADGVRAENRRAKSSRKSARGSAF